MFDKDEQTRRLYEEAVYWHMIHNGQRIRRDLVQLKKMPEK